MDKNEPETGNPEALRSIVVVFSYHHGNTEKIANAGAKVLGAEGRTPRQGRPEEIAEYGLVGFGSGISSATFDASILDLADRLSALRERRPSSSRPTGPRPSLQTGSSSQKNHRQIREKLQAKGYTVIGEFGCAGWNTNSFLHYFGGLNKGRPNAGDLGNAETFARDMREKARG